MRYVVIAAFLVSIFSGLIAATAAAPPPPPPDPPKGEFPWQL
jgi:hypothetical protein